MSGQSEGGMFAEERPIFDSELQSTSLCPSRLPSWMLPFVPSTSTCASYAYPTPCAPSNNPCIPFSKDAAMNEEECERMIVAARENDVKLQSHSSLASWQR